MSILFVGGIALAVPLLVALVKQLGWNMGGIAISMYTVILFAGTSVAPFISVYFKQFLYCSLPPTCYNTRYGISFCIND
ncbi:MULTISPECIES: hypothetical protein [Lysinibacillus]|uniref:hypothetical protein n=1 Tax=Lysinibacillus TaxID=400634 RepID=UPI001C8C7040|nr:MULTISPECIES: hypothetical protein [Lysinibacillus]MBX8944541.1 hypothetical protein [Lysinibacillus sp. K60]UUV23391.1 hypothetical protein NP781_16100 [Lysinibacillus sp. FN11]UYB46261.1 hypothetical protein OCI51_18710 [Lysinibacillus capsici]WHP41703.1 hypothetical protein QIX46_01465 [Lysinibacillus boronitolerans]